MPEYSIYCRLVVFKACCMWTLLVCSCWYSLYLYLNAYIQLHPPLCVYINAYLCACTWMHLDIHIYLYTCDNLCADIRVRVHTCSYARIVCVQLGCMPISSSMLVCSCDCKWVCTRLNACMQKHTWTCICTCICNYRYLNTTRNNSRHVRGHSHVYAWMHVFDHAISDSYERAT
jgi:hypothetical protein